MKSATTDLAGAFSVAGLPAGDYRIWVTAPNGSPWISAWNGGATFDSATKYSLLLGDVQAGADVVLFAGGTIKGTVTGAGASLSSAQVTAVRVDGTTLVDVLATSTAMDGLQAWLALRPVRTTSASARPTSPTG